VGNFFDSFVVDPINRRLLNEFAREKAQTLQPGEVKVFDIMKNTGGDGSPLKIVGLTESLRTATIGPVTNRYPLTTRIPSSLPVRNGRCGCLGSDIRSPHRPVRPAFLETLRSLAAPHRALLTNPLNSRSARATGLLGKPATVWDCPG
jgi:hypothetical protein